MSGVGYAIPHPIDTDVCKFNADYFTKMITPPHFGFSGRFLKSTMTKLFVPYSTKIMGYRSVIFSALYYITISY